MNHKRTIEYLSRAADKYPLTMPMTEENVNRINAMIQGVKNTEKLRALEESENKRRKRGGK